MRVFAILILLLVILLGALFTVLNAQTVELNYYFSSSYQPLALVIVLSFTVGAFIGVLASLGFLFRQRRDTVKLKRDVKLMEKEINNLRTLPMREPH